MVHTFVQIVKDARDHELNVIVLFRVKQSDWRRVFQRFIIRKHFFWNQVECLSAGIENFTWMNVSLINARNFQTSFEFLGLAIVIKKLNGFFMKNVMIKRSASLTSSSANLSCSLRSASRSTES